MDFITDGAHSGWLLQWMAVITDCVYSGRLLKRMAGMADGRAQRVAVTTDGRYDGWFL
jgi:hypothetical protein